MLSIATRATSALSLSALLALAGQAQADGLNASLVDARAKLLIHIDVEQLIETEMFKLLSKDPEAEMGDFVEEFQSETGLDPTADVRSITVYGNSANEKDWVALIRTSGNLDSAMQKLSQKEGYSKVEVGGRMLHSLKDGRETWYGYVYNAEQGDDRLFVVSENQQSVLGAIDVVSGKQANLVQAREPAVSAQPGPGSVLFVSAGIGLDGLSDFEATAKMAKLVQGVTFDCGEDQGVLFATLQLQASQHDDAQKLYQVIQGGIALLSLASGSDEELGFVTELVNSLDIQLTNTRVTLSFRHASASLYEGLRSLDD